MTLFKATRIGAGILAGVGMIGAASAADLGEYRHGSMKDEPVAVYGPNWAGFYAGVHAGYAWGDAKYEFNEPGFFGGPGDRVDQEPGGGFGGMHVGYNFQRGNVVFGIEGTLSGAAIHDKTASPLTPDDVTFETSIGAFGTVAARLGYAWDRTLLYAKGGYAFADVKFEANSTDGDGVHFDEKQTMNGYVLGAGLEYALTNSWVIGVEYNYVNLGNERFSGVTTDGDADAEDLDTDLDFQTVSARISYKFGAETNPLK